MKTLQITEANARKKYFSKKVTDCDTYEELCDFIGEPPIDEAKLKQVGFTQDEIDYRKLKQITKAYNDGWVADYNDENQQKWIPWFYFSPSGARFDHSLYSYSSACAGHAASLCFKDEATSTAAGIKFIELYARFLSHY